MRNEILYPIFLKTSLIAKDDFWKDMFQDFSYGVFPYGIYVKNNVYICCNIKDKEFILQFSNKNTKDLLKECMEIFTNTFVITSSLKQKSCLLSLKGIDWQFIKREAVRNVLIERYVLRKKYQYGLSFKQCSLLLSHIMLGIYFKIIPIDFIDYDPDGCQIKHIKGVEFEDNRIKFQNIFKNLPTILFANEKSNENTFKSVWNKKKG